VRLRDGEGALEGVGEPESSGGISVLSSTVEGGLGAGVDGREGGGGGLAVPWGALSLIG